MSSRQGPRPTSASEVEAPGPLWTKRRYAPGKSSKALASTGTPLERAKRDSCSRRLIGPVRGRVLFPQACGSDPFFRRASPSLGFLRPKPPYGKNLKNGSRGKALPHRPTPMDAPQIADPRRPQTRDEPWRKTPISRARKCELQSRRHFSQIPDLHSTKMQKAPLPTPVVFPALAPEKPRPSRP